MCTFDTSAPCPCPGLTTDDVLGVMAVLGGCGALAVVGPIIQAAPGFYAVIGICMLSLAPDRSRRWVGYGLRLAVRALWRRLRGTAPDPGLPPILELRSWQIAMVLAHPSGIRELVGTAVVTGDWGDERGVQTWALAEYAAGGGQVPAGARLECAATPAGPAAITQGHLR